MGIAIVALAVVAASLHLPDVTTNTRVATESIWTHGRLIAGAIGIFLCVGAEVSITGSLAAYLSLPDVGHLSTKTAVQLVPLFWVGCIIGAFLGAALMRRFRAGTLLAIFALGANTSLAISIITSGPVAVWSIVACGLFSSIIFPSVFVIGLRKLKEAIGQGSGLMVAATIGGLVVPTVQSVFADRVGLHRAMILPLACYAYIFFFGLSSARSKERLAAE
jgi:FHS family L-fucose permease-like MFS transporter